MSQTYQDKYQRSWKICFVIFSAILLIVMPLISHQYGQSGDEWLQLEYGHDIWEYFFNGNPQALGYSNKSLQYANLEFYGGLFDFGTEILHRWLSSIPILHLRHFVNALFGATMMIFTGLFAWRISGKRWQTGLLALLFVAFSPRIFGESMNNPKDIPFGCGFIMTSYFFLALLQELPDRLLKNTLGIFIGFTIAFGVRPAGGLLLVVNFIVLAGSFFVLDKNFRNHVSENKYSRLKKTIVFIGIALAAGYFVGLLAWPWGLQAPLTNPLESLRKMTNIDVTLRVFFEGVFRPNNAQPWYYELKWILISNPLIVIFGVVLFILLILDARKKYGTIAVIFVLFAAFFTPLYMIYKKSSVHDTWRHLFFIYPFWVTMAALAYPLLEKYLTPKFSMIPFAVAVLGLVPAIAWTFRVHPNQYVYFNESVGGIRGAYGYYDTDYYQNSGLQDADWIRAHARRTQGKKILVASNMLGFDKYFAKDSAWISYYYVRYNDRHTKDWDYYVTYSRYISAEQLQNDRWPPKNAVYEVKADGVILSAVLERKSKMGILANEALQKQNFAEAAKAYSAYVAADPYDENAWVNYGIALASIGQMDASVVALNKAVQIDPGNPGFFQVLAQVYKSKGDINNAQQAINNANALIMREQEAVSE